VLVEGVLTEATLKRVYKRRNVLELHAANPAYAVMSFSQRTRYRVRIVGKYVSALQTTLLRRQGDLFRREIHWQQFPVIFFGLRQGKALKQIPQVKIGLQAVGLCSLNQAVEGRAGGCPFGMTTE